MKEILWPLILLIGLVGYQSESVFNVDKLKLYSEIGLSSVVIEEVDSKIINDVKFSNVFEIIDNRLCGWFSARLADNRIVYFNKELVDDEIPIYFNNSGDLKTDSIQFITDKGLVEIKVDIEASNFQVKRLFEKYSYFAILNRYDESKWTLINSKSAEIYNFTGDIVTYSSSPYFVVVNPYGIGEGELNSIGIYSLTRDGLKCEWIDEGANWTAEDVVWQNEYTISYSEVYYGNNYKVDKKINNIIYFDGIEWKLEIKPE